MPLEITKSSISCDKGKELLAAIEREEPKAEDAALLGDQNIKPDPLISSEKTLTPLSYLSRIKEQRAELKRECSL